MIDDIFRQHSEEYIRKYNPPSEQRKVIRAIINCQTEKMGSRFLICPSCNKTLILHNSCRNRHCPKCQHKERYKWLEKRKTEILNVKYFHIVFTVPHILNQIAYSNKRIFYGTLFEAVNKTIAVFANDAQWLGAQSGAIAILHTWGQNLSFHPHIHVVIPSGGIIKDTEEWINTHSKFFAPVKAMSEVYKSLFCKILIKKLIDKNIKYSQQIVEKSQSLKWVVFAQKPFAKPDYVIDYLGNYTHRVAISNFRIIKNENRKVYFWYKDYKDGSKKKIIELEVIEFIRRFLQHTLPDNFYKIRYFGFMSNRFRTENIQLAKQAIADYQNIEYDDNILEEILDEPCLSTKYPCPNCGKTMIMTICTSEYLLPKPET